jgi:hypothetical protein
MRQISLACILFVTLLACDTAGNVDPVFQDYFVKYYGVDGNQEGIDMLVNPDGSMILLGNSTPREVTFAFMVKIDPLGNVLWQRQLGASNERAADVEADNQGNLIVVSNIGEEDDSRIRIFRLDQQGAGIDSLIIPSDEKQVARAVTQASNNNFLIAGYSAPDPARNPVLQIPPEDEADIIVLQVDPAMDVSKILLRQGGEHVGSAVKSFETILGGSTRYLICGDSDRPIDNSNNTYRRTFELITITPDGDQGLRRSSGNVNQIQVAATAIETPVSVVEGYLMVGTTYSGTTSNLYITQYTKDLEKRLDKTLTDKRLEGVSADATDTGYFYILANEILGNSKRDMYLLKLESDGTIIGGTSFGTSEGDDTGGAVRVLPDGRTAVLGTMELETQRKMILIVMSPDGKFSN